MEETQGHTMRLELQEIDTIYRTIESQSLLYEEGENTLYSTSGTRDEGIMKKLGLKYQYAVERFQKIAPDLSEQELIEGYLQGSKILQMNISGRMARDFSKAYVSLMIGALREGHVHTSRTFIFVLARQLTHERRTFLQEMLHHNNQTIRIETIYNIFDLDIHELIPELQQLVQDKDKEIAQLSTRLLKRYYASRTNNGLQ